MTDKNNPDLDDIDAFLIKDSMSGAKASSLPEAMNLHSYRKYPSRDTSLVARLNNRVSHAAKNLTAALSSAQEINKLLSEEQDSCSQFGEDVHAWENVITDIEAAMKDLPEIQIIDTIDDDKLHEDIADAIASQLDTELQSASEKHNDAAIKIFDAKEMAEEIIILPESEDAPKTPAAVHDRRIDDDEETTNRHHGELLQSLEQQESRIHELEAKLNSLQSTSDNPEATDEHSGLIKRDDHPYVNRLIVAINGNKNLKYPLTQNIMTIGREPHNDIHIRSRYISRFHARIVSDQDGSIIEDLDSRNGLTVNSQKVRRQVLKSGDLIDLGRTQLKYIDLMEGSADEGRA